MSIPTKVRCAFCDGTGRDEEGLDCSYCDGTGRDWAEPTCDRGHEPALMVNEGRESDEDDLWRCPVCGQPELRTAQINPSEEAES